MIITIDGPTASGKSTLAKTIAMEKNYFYINSGILYRSYAYILKYLRNINIEDKNLVIQNALLIKIKYSNSENCLPIIIFENNNISNVLEKEQVGFYASIISQYAEIREIIDNFQQNLSIEHNFVIVDGRDTGVKVFPNASLKIFLTAFIEERIKRLNNRIINENTGHLEINLKEILKIKDKNDIKRIASPIRPAHDAFVIDSTKMNKIDLKNFCMKLIKGFTL